MSMPNFLETRWLKRARLGPADVYPQNPKQKEDELTSVNVKQGFNNPTFFNEEYESTHLYSIDPNKISASFSNVLTHKQVINTFNDAGKKRPQVAKENFQLIPVINPKVRIAMQVWFKDLSSTKPLSQLCKRVPVFSKKEDIFQSLADYEIPLVRATWFIKMTAAYHLTQTDAKMKKRTTNDPNSDWTQAVCRFLHEQLSKLNEDNALRMNTNAPLSTHINVTVGSVGAGTIFYMGVNLPTISRDELERQLQYISNLAHHMYTEGLLDRQDFLSWLVDEFECISLRDEIALSYFMPFILQYVEEVVINQLLARKMCFVAARHLNWIFRDGLSSRSTSPAVSGVAAGSLNTTSTVACTSQTQQQCPPHLRSIAHTLSCAIQCTAITCPGALVWYPPADPKSSGSPLDLLPCAPSSLPLPDLPKDDSTAAERDVQARQYIVEKEREITQRSLAAEMHWSSDKCQESTTGYTINRVLNTLDALDKQNFDRFAPLDLLYNKIFDYSYGKEGDIQLPKAGEDAVVGLLCEWAITAKRLGEHRASLVAKLLDMRQIHYQQEQTANTPSHVIPPSTVGPQVSTSEQTPTTDAQPPDQALPSRQTPYFQNLLFMFLDTQAPALKNPDDMEELEAFRNLVLLFSELIEHDVFSHGHYVNMLISRGDVSPNQTNPLLAYTATSKAGNAGSQGPKVPDVQHMDSGLDENPPSARGMLDIKGGKGDLDFSAASDSVFSPDGRHDRHFLDAVRPMEQNNNSKQQSSGGAPNMKPQRGLIWGYDHPRHVQYITHFPLPFQNEGMTYEWNQRLVVLHGAGRQKSLVKRAVRKVTRHLIKLVQSKRSIDGKQDNYQPMYWELGKRKNKPNNKSSHDEFLASYRALSYFDQHMVTSNAAKALLNSLNNYIAERSSVLPSLQVIVVLFDLMEEALNIGGLVQTATSVCSCLAPLSLVIKQKQNDASDYSAQDHLWYTTELSFFVVAILRHYQCYLMLNTDLALESFEGLLALSKQTCLSNPAQCTSPDRCILVFLNDLYNASTSYMRANYAEFGSYTTTVRQALYSTKKPATSNCRYDPTFLRKYIVNPELESCLRVAERFSDRLMETVCRYSFVCTAVITVCCEQQTFEKVHALAALCAEMNARCNELSAEWLGVLKALCCSSSTANFNDVLMAVEASDPHIRDPLALFTAVLIARGALSLEDVVKHVAIPAVLYACNQIRSAGGAEADPGARLTCHLLLHLFETPVLENSPTSSKQFLHLPSSSDRRLLATAQRNIADGAVLAVLKAVLKLSETGVSGRKGLFDDDVSVMSFLAPIPDFNDLDINMPNPVSSQHSNMGGNSWMEGASLSEFAKHAVRLICSHHWVRDRCIKNPNMGLFMDQVLTRDQRQNLIQLICCPDGDLKKLSLLSSDPQQYVANILRGMTRWSLRLSLLELHALLLEPPQDKILPEHIAKATIEVFQEQQLQQSMEPSREQRSLSGPELDRCNVWLIAPFISKLPSQVQGRVLQEASVILEAPPCTSTRSGVGVRGDRHDRNYGGSSLLNHQPFLTLILTCLKGQDQQRDSLLESLQSQIIMLHSEWQNVRSQRDAGKDFPYCGSSQNGVHDALQLRLSLVGGMFDTVQGNSQWTSDVVVLLTQLINSGMVDIQANFELFNIVYDMIAILLHNTLGGDVSTRAEGSKREYMNIVKKMKKEIGEHHTESVCKLRQLLPIQRPDVYIVCCEPIGPLMDIKGNKIPVPVDGNSGLQAASKQKLNVWEIIEGLKNPAPLCLAWFGARKMERKMLYYEKEHALLMHHEHGSKRSLENLLKPPELPPEEDEVIPPPPKMTRKPSIKVTNPAMPTTPTGDSKRTSTKPKIKKEKRLSASQRQKIETPHVVTHRNNPFAGPNSQGPMIKTLPQQPITNNFGMTPHNPPAYQQQYPQNNINAAINANTYQQTGNFGALQQHSQQVAGLKGSKHVLEKFIRTRTMRNAQENATIGGYPMADLRNSPVRQKLVEGMKPQAHMGGHEMYNSTQARPPMQQQQHMITQQPNPSYANYNMTQKPQQGLVQNYNTGVYRNATPAAQMTYQQTNTAPQPTQQYSGGQQMRTGNYAIQQGGNYGNQPQQMLNMQGPSQQQQYTMTQQRGTRAQQMNRIASGTQQIGMHQINPNQGMPQNTQMNQRQMMNAAPRQYGQQMQNPQPPNTMMDMRRNMMSQQPSQY